MKPLRNVVNAELNKKFIKKIFKFYLVYFTLTDLETVKMTWNSV